MFKKSISKGNSNAMLNYGLMLQKGDGINTDPSEAAHMFKLSADSGNIIAMYAIMLYQGDGIPYNLQESFRYFKMSADQGYVKFITEC